MPIGIHRVVDCDVRTKRARPLELFFTARGDDRPRAGGFGKEQHKGLHAAADARNQHRFSRFQLAAREERAIGGEAGQRNRRGLLHREMRRLEIHVGFRNRDVLRKGAVARHSENRRSLGPELSITAPTKHRIDDDLGRAFLMNAGAIGPERTRQRDAGVESLGDKYVAPVEGRRAYTHERLVRRRHGAIAGFWGRRPRAIARLSSSRSLRRDCVRNRQNLAAFDNAIISCGGEYRADASSERSSSCARRFGVAVRSRCLRRRWRRRKHAAAVTASYPANDAELGRSDTAPREIRQHCRLPRAPRSRPRRIRVRRAVRRRYCAGATPQQREHHFFISRLARLIKARSI